MDKGLPPKSAILVAAIDPNRHGGSGEPPLPHGHSCNGAKGISDIEGKVARGSGEEMEPRGRERHRCANRQVEMGGST